MFTAGPASATRYTLSMRLVLFDVDGTLLSASGAGSRALSKALQLHYGVRDGLRNLRLDGKTDPLIVREALQRSGRSCGFDGQLPASFIAVYARLLSEELNRCADFAVLPGVLELIRRLRADPRFAIGLATGNVEAGAWLKVEKAGLRSHFSFGGFGSDAEDRTQVILKAIARGRAVNGMRKPQRIVVVGDTPRDVEHARRAGAESLAVATGSFTLDELRACGPALAVPSLHPAHPIVDFLSTWTE